MKKTKNDCFESQEFNVWTHFKDEKKLKAEIDDYMKNYDDLKEKVVLKSYLF